MFRESTEPSFFAERILLAYTQEIETRKALLKALLWDEVIVENRWVILKTLKELDERERLLFEHYSPGLTAQA
jgi:hypothetical protein